MSPSTSWSASYRELGAHSEILYSLFLLPDCSRLTEGFGWWIHSAQPSRESKARLVPQSFISPPWRRLSRNPGVQGWGRREDALIHRKVDFQTNRSFVRRDREQFAGTLHRANRALRRNALYQSHIARVWFRNVPNHKDQHGRFPCRSNRSFEKASLPQKRSDQEILISFSSKKSLSLQLFAEFVQI